MSRAVLQTLEIYQKARSQFVKTVAELADRKANIEALLGLGIMDLLRPLLLDNVIGIRQSAALALGRLAGYSEELAESIVQNGILPHLVSTLSEPNRFFKKAASFVLRVVAKHNSSLAKSVVEAGALKPLVKCLEEFDPSVKQFACGAIKAIAMHTPELAQDTVAADAINHLFLCVQEPEITLKRTAVSAFGQICKHNAELASSVEEAQVLPFLSTLVVHPDPQLVREVFLCMSNIAKHSNELAEKVAENELFPKIYKCLKHDDLLVRKYACTCIREIARQSPELARIVSNDNGVKHLVEYISEVKGNAVLPGIAALGFIAGFDESIAMTVIAAQGIQPLKDALINGSEEIIRQTAAWSLGQIGYHSNDHARPMAESDNPAIAVLLGVYKTSGPELKKDCKRALKNILQVCNHLSALEPLISESPPEILPYILNQFSKNLQNDHAMKKSFVLSGGLKKILEIKSSAGMKQKQYIEAIIGLYPTGIIDYHSPDYKDKLLKEIDDYNAGER